MKILGISGSLRKGSFNTAILKTMQTRYSGDVEFEIADLSEIPLYNGDLDGDNPPETVTKFKAAIEKADALIMATPEYNYSVTGVLKNAIDWASRPAFKSPLKDKHIGIISSSMGFTGGVRAQQHLKTILLATLSNVIPMPEIVIGGIHNQIKDGILIDENTLKYLDGLVEKLKTTVKP